MDETTADQRCCINQILLLKTKIMTHRLIITVMVLIESELTEEQVLAEFQQETDYNFGSTDNCKVKDTDLREAVIEPL